MTKPKSQPFQAQITYSSEQDRLILTLGSTTDEAIRLWLTRRFVSILWPVLIQALELHPEIVSEKDNRVIKQVKLDFQHQQTVAKADHTSAFNQDRVFPIGKEPVLIVKADISTQATTQLITASFISIDDKKIDINLNQALLHNLCHLIIQAMPSTGWGLALEGLNITQSEPSTPGPVVH